MTEEDLYRDDNHDKFKAVAQSDEEDLEDEFSDGFELNSDEDEDEISSADSDGPGIERSPVDADKEDALYNLYLSNKAPLMPV